jgi:hypothetical protein
MRSESPVFQPGSPAANPAAAFSPLGYHRLSGRAHPQRSWDGAAWGPYWLWLRTGRAVAEPAPAAAFFLSELPQKRLFLAWNSKLDSPTHLVVPALDVVHRWLMMHQAGPGGSWDVSPSHWYGGGVSERLAAFRLTVSTGVSSSVSFSVRDLTIEITQFPVFFGQFAFPVTRLPGRAPSH